MVMIPADEVRGGAYAFYRAVTHDNAKVAFAFIDWGNASLPGQHHVFLSRPEDITFYDPTSEVYTKPKAASRHGSPRAQTALAASQEDAKTVARPRRPTTVLRGPEEITRKEVHWLTQAIPSAAEDPKEPQYPIYVNERWGGTPGLIPPEGGRRIEDGTRIHSSVRLPGDMYAFGGSLLRIGSGNMHLPLPDDPHGKKVLCESQIPRLWHDKLGKHPRPAKEGKESVPEEWALFLDFVMGMLTYRPEHRLTPATALQHPFIQLADKFKVEDIPKSSQLWTSGGRKMNGTAASAAGGKAT